MKLPSITDRAEYGESALNYPLAYDEIESVPIDLTGNRKALFKDELRRRSAVRVRHDPQFQDIAKGVQQLNERLKNNRLSLNETTRRTERAKDIKQREKEEAERRNAEHADQSKIYELNLAHVNKRQLPRLAKTLATAKPAPNALDESGPAKRETLNILSDIIGFSKSSRTVGR